MGAPVADGASSAWEQTDGLNGYRISNAALPGGWREGPLRRAGLENARPRLGAGGRAATRVEASGGGYRAGMGREFLGVRVAGACSSNCSEHDPRGHHYSAAAQPQLSTATTPGRLRNGGRAHTRRHMASLAARGTSWLAVRPRLLLVADIMPVPVLSCPSRQRAAGSSSAQSSG